MRLVAAGHLVRGPAIRRGPRVLSIRKGREVARPTRGLSSGTDTPNPPSLLVEGRGGQSAQRALGFWGWPRALGNVLAACRKCLCDGRVHSGG